MKKVGIVVDNYKLDRFRKALNDKGFTDYDIMPFTANTSTIRVNVEAKKVSEIYKICQLVELHFKRSN